MPQIIKAESYPALVAQAEDFVETNIEEFAREANEMRISGIRRGDQYPSHNAFIRDHYQFVGVPERLKILDSLVAAAAIAHVAGSSLKRTHKSMRRG